MPPRASVVQRPAAAQPSPRSSMSRFTACLANRRRARPWGGQIGVNRGHQRVGFDRFEVHRLGAEEKATLEIDAGIPSMEQDHRALGASGLDSCEELESVAVRHVDVGEDELHVFPVQHVECLEPVRRRVHPEPFAREERGQCRPEPRAVVDDENGVCAPLAHESHDGQRPTGGSRWAPVAGVAVTPTRTQRACQPGRPSIRGSARGETVWCRGSHRAQIWWRVRRICGPECPRQATNRWQGGCFCHWRPRGSVSHAHMGWHLTGCTGAATRGCRCNDHT